MAHIGEVLRALREEWGYTLRDVEKRSKILAEEWGNSDYAISHGYLHQVEETGNNVSARKLVSLAEIYSVSPESLFQHCIPKKRVTMVPDQLGGPRRTMVLTEGRLAERATILLPDDFGSDPVPEQTTLLKNRENNEGGRYRRVIVGAEDLTLYPLINPGSILKIDTFRRSIAPRKEWGTSSIGLAIFSTPEKDMSSHGANWTIEGNTCGWCLIFEVRSPPIWGQPSILDFLWVKKSTSSVAQSPRS